MGRERQGGRLLGAHWMLHGALARQEGELVLTAHLTDLETTLVLASSSAVGAPEIIGIEEQEDPAAGLVADAGHLFRP